MSPEYEPEPTSESATGTQNPNEDMGQTVPKSSGSFPMFRGRKPVLHRIFREQRDLYERMLQFIRLGAYDYQVAAAMGVAPDTFARWMRNGARAKKGLYRRFYRDVIAARGQSRVLAEMTVRRDDPKFWLTHGPGKTKPDQPGWTDTIVVSGDSEMPIAVDHHHSGNINHNIPTAPPQELAASLAILQQLGILGIDPVTKQPIINGVPGVPTIVDGRVTQVVDDEDESVDYDEDDARSDKGYNPDADLPIDEIPRTPPPRY